MPRRSRQPWVQSPVVLPKRYRGVNRESDPGAIPLDQFYYLQNVRIHGDEILSRGGQTDDGTLNGCVDGMFDDGNPLSTTEVGLFYYVDPSTSGAKLKKIDRSGVITEIFDDETTVQGPLGSFAGTLLVSDGNDCYSVNLTTGALSLLFTVPGAGAEATISSLLTIGGTLYVVCSENYVYTWNGSSLVEDENALGAELAGVTDGTDLYVGGVHTLFKRDGGAYTSLTMPMGLTEFYTSFGKAFNSKFYVGGADFVGGGDTVATIIEVDGATLTTARQPGPIIAASGLVHGIRGLDTIGSNLYYVYNGSTGLTVGQYTGSAWTDDFKELSSVYGGGADPSIQNAIAFTSKLYIQFSSSPFLISSPANDVAGTWVTVDSTDYGSVPLPSFIELSSVA